jgi:hypothetical protein
LLDRVRAATKPGGVVAVGIAADRVEVDDHGRRRPALLESAMSTAEATGLLSDVFSDFDVTCQRFSPAQVREERGEDTYTLTSTLVTWLATRPGNAVHLSRGDVRSGHGLNGRHRTSRVTSPAASAKACPRRQRSHGGSAPSVTSSLVHAR